MADRAGNSSFLTVIIGFGFRDYPISRVPSSPGQEQCINFATQPNLLSKWLLDVLVGSPVPMVKASFRRLNYDQIDHHHRR